MPGTEFFERMQPEFEQQASSARDVAERQVDVERLIAKGEYEVYQLRRALSGLVALDEPSADEASPVTDEAAATTGPLQPAKAA
jgi:hypothetical protein